MEIPDLKELMVVLSGRVVQAHPRVSSEIVYELLNNKARGKWGCEVTKVVDIPETGMMVRTRCAA